MPIRSSTLALLLAGIVFGASERQALAQPPPSPSGTAPAPSAPSPDEPKPPSTEPPKPAEASGSVSVGVPTAPPSTNPEPKKKEDEGDVEATKAIFFSGDIGFTRGQLGIAPHHLGFDKTGANGVLYGLLAGVRFDALRLGLRWRVHDTTEFSLWTFDAAIGYALSMRPLTPVFTAHLGYVYDQRLQDGLFRSSIPPGTVVTPDVDLRGILGGVDVSAQYWVTKAIRLGGFLGVDAMFLFRPQVDRPQSLFGPQPTYYALPLYSESGNTLGLNFNVGFRGEFDIALH
jgi:hypothetical protein